MDQPKRENEMNFQPQSSSTVKSKEQTNNLSIIGLHIHHKIS